MDAPTLVSDIDWNSFLLRGKHFPLTFTYALLQENFNVWIKEKHKIIDVPILPNVYRFMV